jgi:multicomponent Na+:H+ antiporter subunit A
VRVALALWHGVTLTLVLSVVTLAGGAGVYVAWRPLRRAAVAWRLVARLGPARGYDVALAGLNWVAWAQTRLLQSGYLRRYVLTVVVATVGVVGAALGRVEDLRAPTLWADVPFYEVGLAGIILLTAVTAAGSASRYVAVTALGVLGYAMALIFVRFGAPDLAITQVLVDTLTVILFVLVFYHLPQFARLSSEPARARDVLVALAGGGLVTGLMLVVPPSDPAVSRYYAEHSVGAAHGRNIVNVILVDFRGLDTLGEITVLALAGVGVYTLLKLRTARRTHR